MYDNGKGIYLWELADEEKGEKGLDFLKKFNNEGVETDFEVVLAFARGGEGIFINTVRYSELFLVELNS